MNKHVFLFAVMAMTGLAACDNDAEPKMLSGETVSDEMITKTVSINMDEIRTRSSGDDLPLWSVNSKGNVYLDYAIYARKVNDRDQATTGMEASNWKLVKHLDRDLVSSDGHWATVTITYAKGLHDPHIVFWAAKQGRESSVYQLYTDAMKIGYKEAFISDKVVDIDENCKAGDGFYAWVSLDQIAETGGNVILKRPFAQVNIITEDHDATEHFTDKELGMFDTGIYNRFSFLNGSNKEFPVAYYFAEERVESRKDVRGECTFFWANNYKAQYGGRTKWYMGLWYVFAPKAGSATTSVSNLRTEFSFYPAGTVNERGITSIVFPTMKQNQRIIINDGDNHYNPDGTGGGDDQSDNDNPVGPYEWCKTFRVDVDGSFSGDDSSLTF